MEEEEHDRDPAVTLADGVLNGRARSLRPPVQKPPRPRPGRRHRDPLRAMMHCGSARLRHDVQAEAAIRHAAEAAVEPPRTTAEAAQLALALEAAAAPLPRNSAVRPTHDIMAARLRSGTAAAVPPDAGPQGFLRAWTQGP